MREPSIERIYKTKAYDKLEAFCDDDQGGASDFFMSDKFDRQQVVNLIVPIIRNETRNKQRERGRERMKTVIMIDNKYFRDSSKILKGDSYSFQNSDDYEITILAKKDICVLEINE